MMVKEEQDLRTIADWFRYLGGDEQLTVLAETLLEATIPGEPVFTTDIRQAAIYAYMHLLAEDDNLFERVEALIVGHDIDLPGWAEENCRDFCACREERYIATPPMLWQAWRQAMKVAR